MCDNVHHCMCSVVWCMMVRASSVWGWHRQAEERRHGQYNVLLHHLHEDHFLSQPLSDHATRPTCAVVFQPVTDLWVIWWIDSTDAVAQWGVGVGGSAWRMPVMQRYRHACLMDNYWNESHGRNFRDISEHWGTTGEVMSLPCKYLSTVQIIVLLLSLCLRETYPSTGKTYNYLWWRGESTDNEPGTKK